MPRPTLPRHVATPARTGRNRRAGALACAAIGLLSWALLLAAPSAASAAERGVDTDLTWGIPTGDFAPTQAAIGDLQARWVRVTMFWYEGEPQKGSYSSKALAKWDKAVAVAQAAGAKVVAVVARSPQWASGSTNQYMPPRNSADYADFLRFLAARYKGKVAAWEIWNEENSIRFWPSGPNAAAYTSLLRAAYPAVKQGDPSAVVVFGGLQFNDESYVSDAYAAGAKGYFDAMSVHPYSFSHPPDDIWYSAPGDIARTSFQGYRDVRQAMLDHGDNKPIWFTEFGWSTTTAGGGVTSSQQAAYLTRALCILETTPYVQVAVWYNLRNNFWNNDADTWETQLGLMRTNFSHKPAYDAFRGFSPSACPAPTPPPPSSGSPSPPPPSGAPTSSPGVSSSSVDAPAAGSGTSFLRVSARGPTSVALRVRRLRAWRVTSARSSMRGVIVSGQVRGAAGGRARLCLRRWSAAKRRWLRRAVSVRLTSQGTFRLTLRLHAGRWRLWATYAGTLSLEPSRSGLVRVRL